MVIRAIMLMMYTVSRVTMCMVIRVKMYIYTMFRICAGTKEARCAKAGVTASVASVSARPRTRGQYPASSASAWTGPVPR